MAIESEDDLKMKIDEVRGLCDKIELTMQTAGPHPSYLDKNQCMRLAQSIKEAAFELNNYFAFLEV